MTKEEQLAIINEIAPLTVSAHGTKKVRHTFFKDIKTELQAYLLGFFAADGNINEKRKTLRLHQQLQDVEVVDLLKDTICPEARVYYKDASDFIGSRGNLIHGHASYGADINSTQLCQDLVSLGFGYNKTYSELKLPNIPKELLPHFIRGYFDGDGAISGWYVSADIKWHKNERFRAYATICSKKENILQEIAKELSQHGIKATICHTTRDDMYKLDVAKSQLPKLYDYFYKDAHFYLLRKFSKFDHYVNTEVTQLIAEHRNA